MEEQLSGACTTEIAAFDEFTGLLTDAGLVAKFDHIVFDTAPTDIRSGCCNYRARGTTTSNRQGRCFVSGPLAGLDKQRAQDNAAVNALPIRSALAEFWWRALSRQHYAKLNASEKNSGGSGSISNTSSSKTNRTKYDNIAASPLCVRWDDRRSDRLAARGAPALGQGPRAAAVGGRAGAAVMILITGKDGLLGWELRRALAPGPVHGAWTTRSCRSRTPARSAA